jgi:hypothetical protein
MGQALLAELRRTNNRVRIIPNWDFTSVNSHTSPWNPTRETTGEMEDWIAATAKGEWVLPDDVDDDTVGTGAGISSSVEFTPFMYRPTGGDPWSAPDRALYHELVHASRKMRGVASDPSVNKGYKNREEYIAIILANIYLSEKGWEKFIGNHSSQSRGAILSGEDAANFLHNPQHVNVPPTTILQNFKDTQGDFYRDIVNLPPGHPKYNWVQQYEHEPAGAGS